MNPNLQESAARTSSESELRLPKQPLAPEVKYIGRGTIEISVGPDFRVIGSNSENIHCLKCECGGTYSLAAIDIHTGALVRSRKLPTDFRPAPIAADDGSLIVGVNGDVLDITAGKITCKIAPLTDFREGFLPGTSYLVMRRGASGRDWSIVDLKTGKPQREFSLPSALKNLSADGKTATCLVPNQTFTMDFVVVDTMTGSTKTVMQNVLEVAATIGPHGTYLFECRDKDYRVLRASAAGQLTEILPATETSFVRRGNFPARMLPHQEVYTPLSSNLGVVNWEWDKPKIVDHLTGTAVSLKDSHDELNDGVAAGGRFKEFSNRFPGTATWKFRNIPEYFKDAKLAELSTDALVAGVPTKNFPAFLAAVAELSQRPEGPYKIEASHAALRRDTERFQDHDKLKSDFAKLSSASFRVREAAMRDITEMFEHASNGFLVRAVEPLLAGALRSPDPEVCRRAALIEQRLGQRMSYESTAGFAGARLEQAQTLLRQYRR